MLEVCFVVIGIFGIFGILCLVMLVFGSVVRLVGDNVEIGCVEGVV